MICYLFDAPSYLVFASDIPELLYYSHIPTALIAMLVGLVVFFNDPTSRLNRLLLGISLTFTVWVTASLIAWTNINATFIAAIWPLFGIAAGMLGILSIYFVSVFLKQRDISHRKKIILIVLALPLFLFAHTDMSISGFNLANCDAFDFEGLLYKVYYTALGIIAFLWILIMLAKAYFSEQRNKQSRKQILYLGAGIELFLLSFITITFVVTYLTSLGYFEDSRLEMYGLFSMAFFMSMLGYMIVQFKTFNVQTHAVQALSIVLVILVGSQYTYANSTTTTYILTSITLVLTASASLFLNRSIKRELEQRKELERLSVKLAGANKRLRELDKMKSEFVSIASHQLRSPLTSIRGYASMLIDGSYGKLSKKAMTAVERIAESSSSMATSVEDYLNVSRIEAGNMKYELSDFNFKDEAKKVIDDKRQEATRKGLLLTFTSKVKGNALVHADIGKTRQMLHNLINNSLKYTKEGSVTVTVSNATKGMVSVHVRDTGIGMSQEDVEGLFQKFQRARNANDVNVTGTGLGLFVAQKMASEMGGHITATSDGKEQGSTFSLHLPAA